MAIRANLECGSLLPLSARLLAGALGAGSKLPAEKAGASSRTPYRRDFDVALGWVVSYFGSTRSLYPSGTQYVWPYWVAQRFGGMEPHSTSHGNPVACTLLMFSHERRLPQNAILPPPSSRQTRRRFAASLPCLAPPSSNPISLNVTLASLDFQFSKPQKCQKYSVRIKGVVRCGFQVLTVYQTKPQQSTHNWSTAQDCVIGRTSGKRMVGRGWSSVLPITGSPEHSISAARGAGWRANLPEAEYSARLTFPSSRGAR